MGESKSRVRGESKSRGLNHGATTAALWPWPEWEVANPPDGHTDLAIQVPLRSSRRLVRHDDVPEAANMPPTPWQTEIFALGIWAGAMPRIWRTLSCSA
jgi:hypothetical protein